MKLHLLIGACLIVLFSSVGCKTLRLTTYPAQKVDEMIFKKIEGDIAIGIYPMFDSAERVKYFGTEFDKTKWLRELGIPESRLLPLFVVLESRSTSFSYIVETEQIRLVKRSEFAKDGSPTNSSRLTPDAVAKWLGYINDNGIRAGSSDERVIYQGLVENALRSKTINKSSSAKGFLYFEEFQPDIKHDSQTLMIDVLIPSTQETKTIAIDFACKRQY